MTDHVTIQCTMTAAEAWDLAQFLKRIGFSDFRSKSQDDAEAYGMQGAAIQVANALRDAGYAPR
jgi:hypothetical protein